MATDILVVDDEADIRFMLASILEDEGFDVRQASGYAEALDEIRSRAPGLIILDIWLGSGDDGGLQILDIVKQTRTCRSS